MKESVELMCQLLSCHTPQDQNKIISEVLQVVAAARAIDYSNKLQAKNQSSEDSEMFTKIVANGSNLIDQAYKELDANKNNDKVRNLQAQ